MIRAFPPLLFIVFAAGWWVAAATVRRGWMAGFVVGAFGFALLCGVLARTPEAWLALGTGLLLTVALPGWLMIRAERAS